MRIPLAANLESRDGSVTKDAKTLNAIVEPNGDAPPKMRSRPGNTDLGSIRSGTAQGAYYFNAQVITAHANNADRSTTGPLANNAIGAIQTTAFTISSITRSGSTATVSLAYGGCPFAVGESVTVSGANETEYNGTFVVLTTTATGIASTFTYTVTGTPASPATGAPVVKLSTAQQLRMADNGLIDGTTGYLFMVSPTLMYRVISDWTLKELFYSFDGAGNPGRVVPGAQFMDGYFFIMDAQARIWNCDLNADPLAGATGSFQSTSFIKAGAESGAGVCLGKSGTAYLVALKEHSTEPFFDNGNPAPGSPLSPVTSAVTKVGCASADSVAQVDEMLVWISQSKTKGRSVHMMLNLDQQKISTDDIDRILDNDDLATVRSYGLKIGGHTLYVLTLVTSNITLVYDFTAQQWGQWSSLTLNGSSSTVSGLTISGTAGPTGLYSGTTVTITTSAAHGFADGDPVLMAGASIADFNGIKQISYVSSTQFTFEVAAGLALPTGTITATGYTESYFKFTHYVNGGGKDLLLHETDGHLYQIDPSVHQDAGKPINVFSRTIRLDGGVIDWKRMGRLYVIGDTVSDFIMVRHSNDDSATFSSYRRVDLSTANPNIRRVGPFRRSTIETRFIGNNALRLEALELKIGGQ